MDLLESVEGKYEITVLGMVKYWGKVCVCKDRHIRAICGCWQSERQM
jgi:hypothetical protein